MRSLTNTELTYFFGSAKNHSSLSYTIMGGLLGLTVMGCIVNPRERIPAAYVGFIMWAFIGGASADVYYTIQSFTQPD